MEPQNERLQRPTALLRLPREIAEPVLSDFLKVRAGVALAVALEKTLILPKIMCFCDRSW